MSLRRGRPVVRTRRHCLSQVFVRVSGKPADPTDLPFVETHPDDPRRTPGCCRWPDCT